MSERSYHGATSRSTTRDRSDDPSHHERTLLPRSYISLLLTRNKVYCELGKYLLFIFTSPNITACSVGFPTPVTTSKLQLQPPHSSYNFPTPVTMYPPELQHPYPCYNFHTLHSSTLYSPVTTSLAQLQLPTRVTISPPQVQLPCPRCNFPTPVTTSPPLLQLPQLLV